MSTKLYVGNLSYKVSEYDLKELFSKFGAVQDVCVMIDPVSRLPKGYGYVTMETKESADAAVKNLNARPWEDRNLTVTMVGTVPAQAPASG